MIKLIKKLLITLRVNHYLQTLTEPGTDFYHPEWVNDSIATGPGKAQGLNCSKLASDSFITTQKFTLEEKKMYLGV